MITGTLQGQHCKEPIESSCYENSISPAYSPVHGFVCLGITCWVNTSTYNTARPAPLILFTVWKPLHRAPRLRLGNAKRSGNNWHHLFPVASSHLVTSIYKQTSGSPQQSHKHISHWQWKSNRDVTWDQVCLIFRVPDIMCV